MNSRVLAIIVFQVLWCNGFDAVKLEANEDWASIEAAVRATCANTHSLTASWVAIREFTPKTKDRPDLPRYMKSPGFVEDIQIQFWFDRGRFRVQQRNHVGVRTRDGSAYKPKSEVADSDMAYDGTVWESGLRQSSMVLRREFPSQVAARSPQGLIVDADFWAAIGWHMPHSNADTQPDQVREQMLPLVVSNTENSNHSTIVGEKTVDGVPCFIVSLRDSEFNTEFDLDPAMKYCARAWRRFNKQKQLVDSAKLSDFRIVDKAAGLWIPFASDVTFHQYDGWPDKPSEPIIQMKYKLREMSLVNAIEDTTISLLRGDYRGPGTSVADATHPDAGSAKGGFLNYTIPADSADLDRAIQDAKARSPMLFGMSRSRAIVMGLSIIAAIVIAATLLYRRKNAKS